MSGAQPGRRLLTPEELAEYLGGISVRTIYNGCSRKSKRPFPIRPVRIGKLLRFDKRIVDEWISMQGQVHE